MRLFNITKFHYLIGLIALSFAAFFPLNVNAKGNTITLVVPYASGGTNDNFARMLAKGMSQELGQHVIVDNKPGANGIIGASYVARAKPDGKTISMGGSGPLSLNVLLRGDSLQYKFESFDSVAMLFDGPLTISAASSLGVNSLNELIDYAKKKNEPLLYGTLGPGSVTDLYGLLFSKTFNIPVTAVAYKNNTGALLDLIAGRGDLSYATPIALTEYQKAGSVKILALTSDTRDPSFPDIPSVTELGYPQLKSSYWTGLHVPKGTPTELVEKLANAAIKTVQSKEFKELLSLNGQVERAGGPSSLDEQLQADREYWGKIIQENNIVIN